MDLTIIAYDSIAGEQLRQLLRIDTGHLEQGFAILPVSPIAI